MGAVDYIALAIIFFLLFAAVRYMAVSLKRGGCCGDCRRCMRTRSGCKPDKRGDR